MTTKNAPLFAAYQTYGAKMRDADPLTSRTTIRILLNVAAVPK